MAGRRVVITGMGAVTSIGIGLEEYAKGLQAGRSGHAPITAFDTEGFAYKNGCEVRDFEPTQWIRRLNPDHLGRSSQLGIAASRMALEDAQLDLKTVESRNVPVVVGTTDGESVPLERLTRQWVDEGFAALDPELWWQVPADKIAISVAQEFGLSGESFTVGTACAAGNYAVGTAYDMLRAGQADHVLCGGSDALCRKTFAGFYRLGTVAPECVQPFDKNRQGILTGEGAGMLLVETLDSAVRRGARIYAEILGYGLNCDGAHMVFPDVKAIAECFRRAHAKAGIDAAQVDYICAHGTGTRANDSVEARAIHEVFGEPPPTSSIKSMLGHTMGAASALEAIGCALALHRGFIPPTINFVEPDPECDLDCVPNESRPAELNMVQNNAFAFGGNNSVVIFCRYH